MLTYTLFIKHHESKITIFIVYIDDTVVTRDDRGNGSTKKVIGSKFEIKDLEKLQYFVGIEVARSAKGIFYLSKEVHSGSFERD